MAKRQMKKDDTVQKAMDLGLGLLGGIVSNQGATFLEKQEFMRGNEQYAPMIPAAVGAALYFFLPKEYSAAALGMFITAGTESAESLIAQTTGQVPIAGLPMGFTPQYLPQSQRSAVVRTAQGVVVR